MADSDRVPVIVLAGGASRRMGTDKRLAPIDGVPMLLRTLERLAPEPCLVVVDPRVQLPAELSLPGHASVVADTRPGEGPLAALEAGLLAAEAPAVTVVGGDMPFVVPPLLTLMLVRLAAHPDQAIVCLSDDDGPRPLPLAIHRDRILPRVTSLLDDGERRLRALLPDAEVVEPSFWRMVDPDGGTLRDIDTPADLAPTP